jgi:phosphatidyl-myo-inositol dimannoside synthase
VDRVTKRALVLVSDAFGGRGGLALYNRHLLEALCAYPCMARVVALPRKVVYSLEKLPINLTYHVEAASSKKQFIKSCLVLPFSNTRFDLIICGHLHLLPCARLLQLYYQCPMLPIVYGIDAWNPTGHPVVNMLCRQLRSFIAIRRLTAQRFIHWAQLNGNGYHYLPNCIDESQYGIRPKRNDLLERYKIHGKKVIATAGRLDSHQNERNKGFDEVLEVLPELKKRIPNVAYLIIGDGDDSERLVHKAKSLGVQDQVIFTGYVSDREKADHYRLADVFAMPGSNQNFDRYPYRFVFLEALACGVPVVGCKLDDPEERTEPDSSLIIQVDPKNQDEIIEGIQTALLLEERQLQPAIKNFYFHSFRERLHRIVSQTLTEPNPTRC